MTRLAGAVRSYGGDAGHAWDRFWFQPRAPQILCGMRLATGLLLFYAQLVLAWNLTDFYGPDAWVDNTAIQLVHANDFAWSYLWHLDSPAALWTHQACALLFSAAFACGLLTRLTGPVTFLLQLMTVHRLFGALFGFDQVVTMLTMYLCFAPSGAAFSLDSLLRRRLAVDDESSWLWRWLFPSPRPSVAANVFTRLIQLHVCVIYLFGGIGKMRGEMWWDGTALWFAAANLEYQSLDITWIAHYPVLFALASNLTVLWETFYVAIVWPRLTRPITLAIAVLVHAGIALALGMVTFGTMMIVANAAFLRPEWFPALRDEKIGGS